MSQKIHTSEDFHNRNEVKIRFEENEVETDCDQKVDRLEVATWYITNSTTTEKMTTPGFNMVKVVLKNTKSDYYFLKTDSITEMKPYQSYKFEGPDGSGQLTLTDSIGVTRAIFSK
ncbi:hypothetical protein TWF718_007582 [Orbilia javanica]|uniref:Uncharacterized protein n=1 Tax=Orbilia javanica TaxID=47235 RepID=A0AAN8RNN7_9PEZI